jgi:predicted nucleic-acid-binding protein
MKAVDTNVLVRLLTGDDPKQSAVARELFTTEQIWIAKTVLLEANWVLHSSYDFEDDVIISSFERLIGLDNIHVEDEPSIVAALSLTAHGVKLADAIHLSSRPPGASFLSFDRSFIRRAKRVGAAGVVEL